jgi:hypothetical protein
MDQYIGSPLQFKNLGLSWFSTRATSFVIWMEFFWGRKCEWRRVACWQSEGVKAVILSPLLLQTVCPVQVEDGSIFIKNFRNRRFDHILSLRSFIQRIPGQRLFRTYRNKLVFYGEVLSHAQPLSWRTIPCCLFAAASSIYLQLPPIAGGSSFIGKPRTHHVVVTGYPTYR